MLRFPVAAIGGLVVLCVVVIGMGLYWQDSSSVIQFLILAGLVVNYIDRHQQNSAMAAQIPVTTALTVADKVAATVKTTVDTAAVKVADKVGVVAEEIMSQQGKQ